MKKIMYLLLAMYCISFPFYFLESGNPQISDLLLATAFIIYIFNYHTKKDSIFIISFFIICLIITINMIWTMIYSTNSFMLNTVYYIFNIMLLIMVLNLFRIDGKKVLKVFNKGLYISVFIQVLISPILIETGLTRQTLMFNNPNQLGYFALLSFCIFTLLFYLLKVNLANYIVISLSTLYLALLSNSSSAIISILFVIGIQLILMFIYKLTVTKKMIFILLFLITIIGVYSFWDQISSINIIDNTIERFIGKDELSTTEKLEERRYDRVLENKELLLFGAGEGLYIERFGMGEIHSTIISFFFNYGIITTLFLLILFLLLIRKLTLIPIIIIIAINLYGLTHNGIRQPFFWLTFAVIYIGNKDGLFNLKNILRQFKYK